MPLSSDVFSGWGDFDTNKVASQKVAAMPFSFLSAMLMLQFYLQEVQDATKSVFTERIPAFVKELEQEDITKLALLCGPNGHCDMYELSIPPINLFLYLIQSLLN